MRLWHYKLIPYLPNSQLIAQWRELNTIFVKQPNHILINYVYDYPKCHLFEYTQLVLQEMEKRGFDITRIKYSNLRNYFDTNDVLASGLTFKVGDNPFYKHHDNRYLKQCFYNLQEKYDRGQKDFGYEVYNKLRTFMLKEKLIDEIH